MPRRRLVGFAVVAIACTIGAALCFAAVRPARTPPAAAGAPALDTALWSARRVPAVFVRAAEGAAQTRAGADLAQKLAAIVAPVNACVAVDGPAGPLARINADVPMAPASTLKLLTATTAIDRLGPGYRFSTKVLSDPAGNLVVVGGGDPLLATAAHIAAQHAQPRFRDAPSTPLSALADAVVAAGVHHVNGALLVDDHAHDTLRFLPAWKPIYAQEGDIGSLGALTVDGGFANPNGTDPAPDPALATGQQLTALLAARGVTITGGVRRGLAANGAREIAHVDSPPLSTIVGEMLTSSDNYTAEELLRDIAAAADRATPATTAAGIRIVEQEMTRLGVPTGGLDMHDGSGLAPTDRVTCATMLAVIDLAAEPKFAAIDAGLAVAARSGTLIGRFGDSPLAGKLHAKTGSIAGVAGLVGFVAGPDDLRFAFLSGGNFSTAFGEQLQAAVATAVASTPDLTVPPDLVPTP